MQKEPFWNAKGLLFAMTCSAADVSFKNMRDVPTPFQRLNRVIAARLTMLIQRLGLQLHYPTRCRVEYDVRCKLLAEQGSIEHLNCAELCGIGLVIAQRLALCCSQRDADVSGTYHSQVEVVLHLGNFGRCFGQRLRRLCVLNVGIYGVARIVVGST